MKKSKKEKNENYKHVFPSRVDTMQWFLYS